MPEESQISEFYAFKKILVTGGTGFMGKVLIWKLLHSCPKLDTIYVLIRSKYGKVAMSRKEEFFGSPVFENFKKNNPEIFEKVVLVSGDVGQEGMGLSDKDRNTFIDQVSIVFHSAAILKMNSDLKTAVNVNTTGTMRMLEMAKQMTKLEAFVYISTAYCCCENTTVEEKIYSSKYNPHDIINLVQWMEPKLLKKITPKLIYPLPNTYIFSKRLTEALLPDYASQVPIIVARPSIVIAGFKEPLPGWTDSIEGPTGFFVAAAKGVIRTTTMNLDTKTEIIPVDTAINSILILPWADTKEQLLGKINVYNITQNSLENLTWREIKDCVWNAYQKYPFDVMLWHTNINADTRSLLIYTIKCIFLHYLPAYIIDFIMTMLGRKPFMVRVHDKIRHGEKMLAYFNQREWSFVHDKLIALEKRLNDNDKLHFSINMNEIQNLQSYADDIVFVIKVYAFKEDMKEINNAKRKLKILYAVDKITVVLKYFVVWKMFMYIFQILLNLLHT